MVPNTATSRKIAQVIMILLLLSGLFLIFSPFWMPILMAGIFALGIEPVLLKLGKRLNVRLKVTAWAYMLCLFFFIFVPMVIFVLRSISAVRRLTEGGLTDTQFYANIFDAKNRVLSFVAQYEEIYQIDIVDDAERWIAEAVQWSTNFLIEVSSSAITSFPNFLLSFAIFLITLYLFLRKKLVIKSFFYRNGLLNVAHSRELVQITQKACASTIIASLVTGFTQASIVAVAAMIFNAGDFWIVFLATFFTSFIPAVGAGPVCFLLAVPFLLRGEYFPAIGLTVFALIAGTVDNIIRPYLVGSGEDMNAFLMFLATIGGILIFGLPGIFIGPVITVVAFKVVPLLSENLTK